MPEELPEGYYLKNFSFLLRFVSDAYPALLDDEERALASSFFSLDEDAQKLYVRLSNRKGDLFRTDRVNYAEIPDLPSTLSRLVDQGFAVGIVPALSDAVTLCTKTELQALPQLKHLPRQSRKAELIDQLMSAETAGFSQVNPVEHHDIEVLEIYGQETLARYRLLFFGNFYQDMTEFVLHELVAPFEQYELTGQGGPFENRQAVDRLIILKNLSDLSYEVIESDTTGDDLLALLEHFPERPSERLHARRYDKTINRIARQLERLGRHAEALAAYRRTVSAPSRERRARIFSNLGDHPAALALCEAIEAQPLSESERVFARTFGNRLAKRQKLSPTFPAVRRPGDIPQSTVIMPSSSDRVELDAVQFYNANQDQAIAFYVENMLFRSLFGLCFWDVIFAPVAGVFFNPFQRGPIDLYTEDFVPNRAQLIEQRMQQIAEGEMAAIVSKTFAEKSGVTNHFVSWGYLSDELLELALTHIPISHHLLIFRRMLTDLKNNASGFPDLVLFYPDGYELIEIKGPGDKLQENQTRWFSYFIDHEIPASVVNVEYCDGS